MPTTKTPYIDYEIDRDLAMITEPLSSDALDQLDVVLDARDALNDAQEYIAYAQQQIEAGTFDLAMQDTVGAALLHLADLIKTAAVSING